MIMPKELSSIATITTGAHLSRLMRRLEWSASDMADEIGLHQRTIYALRAGRSPITPVVALALSHIELKYLGGPEP